MPALIRIGRILCIGLLAMPVAAVAQSKEKVTLMLNWYVYGEHAPFFLGIERGIFEKEGIDLEVQEGRGSGITIQAVAAGSVTFGYADVGVMMRAASKGAPVRSLGVLLQTTPAAVIGPAGRAPASPRDLVGKTIAVTPGDAISPIWPLYLRRVGIAENQFSTVSGDAQTKLNAVVHGRADALLGFVTDQGARLPDIMKQPVTMLRFADAGIMLVSTGIVAHRDTIAKRGDLNRRLMRAMTLAVEAAEKDPEAAVDALMKAHPKAGNRDAQLAGLKLAQSLYRTPESKGDRPWRVSPKVMAASLDVLVEYGGLEAASRGKPEDYYTLEFLP